jgi:hypothetical protein
VAPHTPWNTSTRFGHPPPKSLPTVALNTLCEGNAWPQDWLCRPQAEQRLSTVHFTHRGSPLLPLVTPHQRVSPQWRCARCARTAPGLNTGNCAHRQSGGLPPLRLNTSNAPDSSQWHATHLAGTAPCLNPRGCWSYLGAWLAFSCCRKSHHGVKKDSGLYRVGSCPSFGCSRTPPGTSTVLVCATEPLSSTHPFSAHPPCTRTRRRGFTAFSSAPGGRPVVLAYSRPKAVCWYPELLRTRCAVAPLSRLSRVAYRMCGCWRTSLTLQPAPVRSPRGGGRCQPRPAARSGLTRGPPAPFRRKSAHRLTGNDAGAPGGKEVFPSGSIARRGAHWPIRKGPISTAILRVFLGGHGSTLWVFLNKSALRADLRVFQRVGCRALGCAVPLGQESGYILMLAGGAVSWKSRRQDCVSLSTSEAEYVAVSAPAPADTRRTPSRSAAGLL